MSGGTGGDAPALPGATGDPPSPRRSRLPARLALVAVLGALFAVTLVPGSGDGVGGRSLCLVCGVDGTANLVRNVALFLPVGVALALNLGPGWRAVAVAAGLTGGIEAVQMLLPGRNALLGDLVANAVGGAAGVALARWSGGWARAGRRAGGLASLAWALSVAALLVATHALFAMELPRSTYYGQWTPSLGHLETYEGEVLRASVDGTPMESRRLDRSSEVRRALLRGEAVDVEAEVGPPTAGVAPVFAIHDDQRREIVLLGVDGTDLVGRFRQRADELRLQSPDVRWRDAMAPLQVGDTVRLGLGVGRGGPCLRLDGEERCGLGPRVEEGWSLLLFVGEGRPVLRRVLDAGWVAVLLFPLGFFARRHPATGAGLVVLAGAFGAVGFLPAVAFPEAWALAGGGAGAVAGALAARRMAVPGR